MLEICLAVLIAVLLVSVSVPSITGLAAEQRGKQSFEAFDALVRKAQTRSVLERRPFLLVWEKEAIVLRAAAPEADAEEAPGIEVTENQSYELLLPFSLIKEPPREWIFWPTGTCEPARVTFREKKRGGWSARYDALTAMADFVIE